MLPAHVKDAQNTTIVPLKSDAVSKDQVQGNGDSDFKAPDAKAVPQGSKKSKSSSKKTLGPENKTTEQEKVEGDLKKDQEKSSDHKKSSKEAGEVKKSKEAGEVKKGKESGEAVKSKAVNVKETTDFIADSGVELAIEVGHYLYYLLCIICTTMHVVCTTMHIIANLNPFPGNCRADAN